MDLIKGISALIADFVEQQNDWKLSSSTPISIIKADNNSSLPYTLDISEREDDTSIRLHLHSEESLQNVAQAVLAKNGGDDYLNSDGPFHTLIDSKGFSVFCDVSEVSFDQFSENFEGIVGRLEQMLKGAVKQAIELVSADDSDADTDDTESTAGGSSASSDEVTESAPSDTDISQGEDVSPKEAIIQFLERKEWKFRDNSERQSIELGMNLDKYSDHDGKSLLLININYGNDDLVRFQTPMMYKFDFAKTPYSLIASVIAWYQFEYKFLSMSLDPSDGELKISIDIPLAKGVLHHTQVERIVGFMIQFTEETFDEMFDDLLHAPEDAQKRIDGKISDYQQNIEAKKWVRQFETDLVGLSEEKRSQLQRALEELKSAEGSSDDQGSSDTGGKGNSSENSPLEGI
ncbi:hypothetical protein ALT761_02599 [Alteromonas sp. 76-1]|uniref:hypothetical protein n=1 Tax=Alteromonas sp. 76-1 TaxID=2358187 RepID=UPI000FD15D07|nr:hypothetical protein [Alteromonas sp. 76-1]VEL97594.1 hypothetical protein ALT761_02599 [Alteromonas sp. 76-1]